MMKVLNKKQKSQRVGNSFYFGEFGDVDLGISVTEMKRVADIYKDTKHYHKESTEYYLVLEGKVTFEVEGKLVEINQQQTLMVEAGEEHWLVEVKKLPCTIISISSKKLLNDKVVVS